MLAPHCSYGRVLRGNGLGRAYGLFILRRSNGLIALSRSGWV